MAILTIKDYKEVHLSWLSAEKQHGGEWKDNKKKCEKTALLFSNLQKRFEYLQKKC